MLDRIKAMRLAAEASTGRAAADESSRRILFNSQFAWEFGYVEYALATALRLRGHDVRMVICGGPLDYCEQEVHVQARPDCETCRRRLLRRLDAFGLPSVTMSDFLTAEDREEAGRISQTQDVSWLLELNQNETPIGQLAHCNLFHYLRGHPFEISGHTEEVFRRCIRSAILIARAAGRIRDRYRPDIIVSVSGKTLQWAPFVTVAQAAGVPYVTWEDLNVGKAVVTFASNGIAHELPLDEVWRGMSDRPLSETARTELHEHFQRWATGRNPASPYYDDESVQDAEQIRKQLELRRGCRLVSLFPNLCWDSTSIGFDSAFSSMYEWIAEVTRYARRRADVDFVVRAHPGESKLPPAFRSSTPVGRFIRERCEPVPSNLRIVEGDSPISSYGLGAISDVVMTYTSTLGVEFALRGMRPWVVARAPYSGKGFTLDIESAAQMVNRLDTGPLNTGLTERQRARAERYAYTCRFRKVFSFPHLEEDGRFTPPDWGFFAPGGSAVLDDLCEGVLSAGSFLDVGRR